MKNNNVLRRIVITTFLALGVLWSFSSAAEKEAGYLNDRLLPLRNGSYNFKG